jgi:hypothetical protein
MNDRVLQRSAAWLKAAEDEGSARNARRKIMAGKSRKNHKHGEGKGTAAGDRP